MFKKLILVLVFIFTTLFVNFNNADDKVESKTKIKNENEITKSIADAKTEECKEDEELTSIEVILLDYLDSIGSVNSLKIKSDGKKVFVHNIVEGSFFDIVGTKNADEIKENEFATNEFDKLNILYYILCSKLEPFGYSMDKVEIQLVDTETNYIYYYVNGYGELKDNIDNIKSKYLLE